ncbi:MAG: 50S ribosomal protein L29 [Legionellales bacterium]|nr:50S ribosomal protein L29 [Legionellales bacterium]
MNIAELREKTEKELNEESLALTRELFNLRMSKAVGNLKQTHTLTEVRRNIARVKTVIREKQASGK